MAKKRGASPRAALSVQDEASAEAEDTTGLLSSYQSGGGGGGGGGGGAKRGSSAVAAPRRGPRAASQHRVDELEECREAAARTAARGGGGSGGGKRLSILDSTAKHLYERKRDTQIAMINANPERWGGPMPAAAVGSGGGGGASGKSAAGGGGGGVAAAQYEAEEQGQEPELPKPPFPKFCFLIVLANVLALARCMQLEKWQFQPMSVNPMIGPSAVVLTDMGAKVTTMIVKEGQWWRLWSAMFLHGGVVHLFANMFGMWREVLTSDFSVFYLLTTNSSTTRFPLTSLLAARSRAGGWRRSTAGGAWRSCTCWAASRATCARVCSCPRRSRWARRARCSRCSARSGRSS